MSDKKNKLMMAGAGLGVGALVWKAAQFEGQWKRSAGLRNRPSGFRAVALPAIRDLDPDQERLLEEVLLEARNDRTVLTDQTLAVVNALGNIRRNRADGLRHDSRVVKPIAIKLLKAERKMAEKEAKAADESMKDWIPHWENPKPPGYGRSNRKGRRDMVPLDPSDWTRVTYSMSEWESAHAEDKFRIRKADGGYQLFRKHNGRWAQLPKAGHVVRTAKTAALMAHDFHKDSYHRGGSANRVSGALCKIPGMSKVPVLGRRACGKGHRASGIGFPFRASKGDYSWHIDGAEYRIVAKNIRSGYGGGDLFYFAPKAQHGELIARDGYHAWKLVQPALKHARKSHKSAWDKLDGYAKERFKIELKSKLGAPLLSDSAKPSGSAARKGRKARKGKK